MLQEFKKFAIKGNVMDMAVGVIIGAAFTQIVNSLVTDIIMPPLGLLTGGMDFSHWVIELQSATETSPAVTLNIGLFVNAIVNFVIVSFAIFLLIRQLGKLKKRMEALSKNKNDELAQTPDAKQEELQLLREIRDALKKN